MKGIRFFGLTATGVLLGGSRIGREGGRLGHLQAAEELLSV